MEEDVIGGAHLCRGTGVVEELKVVGFRRGVPGAGYMRALHWDVGEGESGFSLWDSWGLVTECASPWRPGVYIGEEYF